MTTLGGHLQSIGTAMNLDLAECHWVNSDLQPSGDKSENISPAIFLEIVSASECRWHPKNIELT